MKGVSRILKADVLGLRILWFLAVTCFLATGAYQVVLLVTQFFEFPTLTNIKEGVISMNDVSSAMPPPQITVCNLNPISSYPQATGIPNFAFYNNSLASLKILANGEIDHVPPSLAQYYQFIGREASIGLGHTPQSFIVDCKLLHLEGLRFTNVDCENSINITLMSTAEYFNCYELIISPSRHGRPVTGLEMTLYLDNAGLKGTGLNVLALDRTAGAKIFIHEPHTTPFININGIYMMPGEWSRIQVTQEKRKRLQEPWGKCYNETDGEIHGYKFGRRHYTLHSCISVCIEKNITEYCGCKDVYLMNLLLEQETPEMKKLPYCQAVGATFFDTYECSEYCRAYSMDGCSRLCELPCEETRYKTTISQSQWPKKDARQAFYERFIKGRIYANRFPPIEIWEDQANLVTSLIEDNFLRVSVYMGDYRYNMFVDNKAMTTSTLLSQLGGALNLWSGITVILIIEIIDLIYHIIEDKFSKDKEEDRVKEIQINVKEVKEIEENRI